MEHRTLKSQGFKTREDDGGKKYLEGYFAVFGEPYEVTPGWIETVERGAFARYLSSGQDVKVLWNHNTDFVLGSTGAGTAVLSEDETGLWGSVEINRVDTDAVNAWARVSRGDVGGCSFGFEISRQDEWWDDDGIYHTRITEVDPLYEVSPCTFPAYRSTSISARNAEQLEEAKKKHIDHWRSRMRERLKGEG